FAQDDVDLLKDELTLSLGARIDKISVEGESTLNPIYEIVNGTINYSPAGQKVLWNKIESSDISYSGNAGLKYSLDESLDLTMSLGYSFRSPSLEERFQYIDQGSYVRVGKPDLSPELGRSADFGLRYYLPDFKLITSVFYNYFNDLVAELPGSYDGRSAFIKTNIGRARFYGFDLRADYNFFNGMVLYTAASYVKGDDITAGRSLPEIPPLNGTIGVKLNLPEIFEAELSSTVFASQTNVAAGEMTTRGYSYFNFYINSAPIKFGFVNLRLSAGIENIFDKEYRNHLSTSRGVIKEEPGRNLFIKINLNW
ncbi:MAG: TonB-dependent receptor, partial [Melioribacteraceae bacterium]